MAALAVAVDSNPRLALDNNAYNSSAKCRDVGCRSPGDPLYFRRLACSHRLPGHVASLPVEG